MPWSEAEKRAFLAMQFEAQDRFYRARFPQARFDVVEFEGVPAGRLYVERRPEEIRIIDIALLPEHRGAGTGGVLLRALLAEASQNGQLVTIHVERTNPARRLYERLGFQVEADGDPIHLRMAWHPRTETGADAAGEAQAKTTS